MYSINKKNRIIMPLPTTQLKNENHDVFLILASPSITILSIYSTPGFLGNHYLELWVVISSFFFLVLKNLKVKVVQSCPTLCDPIDYRVHGILQARILDWVAFPCSRGSSQPRGQTQVSRIAGGWILYQLSHKGSPRILEWVAYSSSSGSSRSRN